MCANELLTTIANNDGEINVVTAKAILKELADATVALRRIHFLSSTFNTDNIHLQEISKISGDILKKEIKA